jgi:outer membrane immunogenic protein
MKKSVLAAAALWLFAGGHAAADGTAGTAAGAVAFVPPPWSGFYLGAGGGAGAVVHDYSVDAPGVGNVLNYDGFGGQGVFGTIIAGYDHQLYRGIVVGLFGDYDFSGISTDLSVAGGLFKQSIDHEHSWSVGGRAGFMSSPTTLWFGTAGYTQAQFDVSSTTGSFGVPDFKGYFVGGGVESQVGRGWALRAEYRFSQFERETISSVPGVVEESLEPSMHSARLGLTYKWGRREEAAAPMK